jgi:hypothetical protein
MEDSKTKFCSFLIPRDSQKKNALPAKAHFSMRHFLVIFLLQGDELGKILYAHAPIKKYLQRSRTPAGMKILSSPLKPVTPVIWLKGTAVSR